MKYLTWGYARWGNQRHVITEQDAFAALCGSRLVDKIRPEYLKNWVPCHYCIVKAGLCEHCAQRPADMGRVEDPFLAEINDEHVKSWFCSECYANSAGGI